MSEQFQLNQEYLLSGRLSGLTEGEVIALGRGLCLALHDRAGACVGGVQAGNVSMTPEGEVGLGGGGSVAADRKWSSEELEYLAPELFWSGTGAVQADLYAAGLMMYAALNGGRMPFAASETLSAAERARAFKLRMSGQRLPEPENGSAELRQTVMKALTFAPDGRWQTPAEMLEALNACAETCETPVPAPAGLVYALPDEPETPEAAETETTETAESAAEAETETASAAADEPEAPSDDPDDAQPAAAVPVSVTPTVPTETAKAAAAVTAKPKTSAAAAAAGHTSASRAPHAAAEEPRRRVTPYIVAGIACVAIILAALLLRSFHKPGTQEGTTTDIDVSVPSSSVQQTADDETDVIEPDDVIEPEDTSDETDVSNPDDETDAAESDVSDASDKQNQQNDNAAGNSASVTTPTKPDTSAKPAPSTTPTTPTKPTKPTTPTQPETTTPTEETKPAEQEQTQTTSPRYELVIRDCSWSMAKALCEQMGGHLVTISDADELDEVTKLADAKGIRLLWAGAYRDLMGNWSWVTGEEISFFRWGQDQPSAYDSDGTPEDYLLLWKRKGSWIYNDSRNDPVADFPTAYSGKIGFICEYEDR